MGQLKVETVGQYVFAMEIVEMHMDAEPYGPVANLVEELVDEIIEFESEFFKAA